MAFLCHNYANAKSAKRNGHKRPRHGLPGDEGGKIKSADNPFQKRLCVPADDTLRARRKSCFLRPDTGPCRANLLSWYFDARMRKCYRFFWGGCQGNGNRFDTINKCQEHCLINGSTPTLHVPYFCSLAFDFGTCFGHYNRWAWDSIAKSCKRRMYSGCGGNQNNFETKEECMSTCLLKPNNTMQRFHQFTTCIPFTIGDLQ